MKRMVIGCCLLIGGIINTIGIIISAAICIPDTNAWYSSYSSKLMFLIFAGNSHFDDGADGLGLGVFFAFGIILIALGLIILAREYISIDKSTIKE